MAPEVETCREEKINANIMSKPQLLPAEVRETERTTLNRSVNVMCPCLQSSTKEVYIGVVQRSAFNYSSNSILVFDLMSS